MLYILYTTYYILYIKFCVAQTIIVIIIIIIYIYISKTIY